MDPVTISATAATALTVLQPYLPTIASKAAEKIGSELPASVGKLWVALKAKLDRKKEHRQALIDLLKNPDDPDLQAAFRVQLKKAFEQDDVFASEIKRLTEAARQQTHIQITEGALAIGDHATAVGKGGVFIEGNAKDNIIITGDKNEVEEGN